MKMVLSYKYFTFAVLIFLGITFPLQCHASKSKRQTEECGRKKTVATPLILGGEEAVENEYPWVAALYDASDRIICSGTIISSNYILTAAHCVTDNRGRPRNKPNNYTIAVSKYYSDLNIKEASSQIRKAKTITINDYYRGSLMNYRNDIAIIKLDEALTLSSSVLPICLDWNSSYEETDLRDGNIGVITGWGYTKPGAEPSPVLKKLTVPYRKVKTCFEDLPEDFAYKYLSDDKFCAGYKDNATGICSGDAGSGLFFKSDGHRYFIRGIASVAVRSEYGCDPNQYSLYTRVSNYLNWIKKVIEEQ